MGLSFKTLLGYNGKNIPKYQQLIFIDDSGDPGFKLKRGSSQLFVIACVIFDSPISAEYTAANLKMLKEQMGWRQEREFKFHRANDEQKKLFFNAVKKHDFKIRQVVNKNSRRMVEFRLVDSRDSVLIQLADMVAGAIMAKYDKNKRSRHDYLRMLKSQIDDIKLIK